MLFVFDSTIGGERAYNLIEDPLIYGELQWRVGSIPNACV